ncbi:unnamed protein product [Haemonchus placei]|uniref:Conserved secreted protein n=1 Tax=Haemonchus placei TaxID=6290 RepID=A0A0N4WHG0_HAEPC|nr:unnamed protein product [Haemonchus placei]
MMLVFFTVLASVVHSVAGGCKASEIVVKTPDSLPNDIAEVLEKQLKNELYDMGGVAAYYVGNVGSSDQYTAVCLTGKKYDMGGVAAYYVGNVGSSDQYTSVCLTGKKIRNLPYCLKLAGGKGEQITLDKFRSAYESCTGKRAPSFEVEGFHH